MLHGTIRNDDFLHNTAPQCWNSVVTIPNNVATMLLQRCGCAVLRIASCNVNFKPIGFYAVLDAVAVVVS